MKLWQGTLLVTVAGLAGCGHHSPIQTNVIVQRGEVVLREPASVSRPFIEEVTVPKAPAVGKPEESSVAVVDPVEQSTDPAAPPKAAAPATPPVELAPLQKIGDYTMVGFDRLAAFAYEVPDDPLTDPKAQEIIEKNEIPENVTQFHNQKVALKGFMMPLKVEGGKITEMLILRDQSLCCYGATPKINEWVSVTMPKGKGVKAVMDVPITIFGTLRVGEVTENGYLVGIYEMDGDRLGGPIDL